MNMSEKKKSTEKRQLVEELHTSVKKKKISTKTRQLVYGYDDLWQADVVKMRSYTRFNKGYYYILTVIDVLSKYAWAVSLKTKNGNEMIRAIAKIIRDNGKCPKVCKPTWERNFTTQQISKRTETLEKTWH